jgi:hypothetical protein
MTREEKIAAVMELMMENRPLEDDRGCIDPVHLRAVAEAIVEALEK